MFRQILVPTDFSPKHINPMEMAISLARKYKSTIHLLHIIEIVPNTIFSEYKKFYKNLEKKAENQMSILMSNYQGKSVQILRHLNYGNRVQEILNFVKEHEIDLIIMNSHKLELENPIHNWGTISYRVALLSEIPVMLVK